MGNLWGKQGFTECLKCNSKQNNSNSAITELLFCKGQKKTSQQTKTVLSWDGCYERNKRELKLGILGSALDKSSKGGPFWAGGNWEVKDEKICLWLDQWEEHSRDVETQDRDVVFVVGSWNSEWVMPRELGLGDVRGEMDREVDREPIAGP